MSGTTYAIETAPLGDYVQPYCAYVKAEGFNDRLLYTPGPNNPYPSGLIAASLQIGTVCELVVDGYEIAADQQLDATDDYLTEFLEDPGNPDAPLLVTKGAALLQSMAAVIRARNDPETLLSAYAAMHTGIVRDTRRFCNLSERLARQHRASPDDKELETAMGEYSGLFIERVGTAALTGYKSVFAMPALLQHDNPKDAGGAHDLVAIAKPYTADSEASEQGDTFITRRVQLKRACLTFCPPDNREPNIGKHATKYRNTYYNDIVLVSGHCDFGGSTAATRSFASVLSREQRSGARYGLDRARLRATRRELLGSIVNPSQRRRGSRVREYSTDNSVAAIG